MKARIESTDDGGVSINFPFENGHDGAGMTMTADQAERLAHALLLQAFAARGRTPGERQFRIVKTWVLR